MNGSKWIRTAEILLDKVWSVRSWCFLEHFRNCHFSRRRKSSLFMSPDLPYICPLLPHQFSQSFQVRTTFSLWLNTASCLVRFEACCCYLANWEPAWSSVSIHHFKYHTHLRLLTGPWCKQIHDQLNNCNPRKVFLVVLHKNQQHVFNNFGYCNSMATCATFVLLRWVSNCTV